MFTTRSHRILLHFIAVVSGWVIGWRYPAVIFTSSQLTSVYFTFRLIKLFSLCLTPFLVLNKKEADYKFRRFCTSCYVLKNMWIMKNYTVLLESYFLLTCINLCDGRVLNNVTALRKEPCYENKGKPVAQPERLRLDVKSETKV